MSLHERLAPNPPRFARALLWFVLPDGEFESIPGDLAEEFFKMDPAKRRGWYWRQVFGSLAPLTLERWRRGELVRSIVILTAVLVPLAAANEIWRYVLSCVPLKTDPSRPIYLLGAVAIVEILCVLGAAMIERYASERDGTHNGTRDGTHDGTSETRQ